MSLTLPVPVVVPFPVHTEYLCVMGRPIRCLLRVPVEWPGSRLALHLEVATEQADAAAAGSPGADRLSTNARGSGGVVLRRAPDGQGLVWDAALSLEIAEVWR